MKYTFTVLIILFCSFAFALSDLEKAMSQLRYARFCTDTLHDSHQALEEYDSLISSLRDSELDSILLVAETERLLLLERVGQRTEMLRSIGNVINLARTQQNHGKLSYLLTLKGFVYYQIGFKNQALDLLEEAHENALNIKDHDNRNLQLGYNSAALSHTIENTNKKNELLNQSYRYFMSISPSSPLYRNAQITGNSYYATAFMENNELDSALHYLSISTSFLDSDNILLDDYYAILNIAKLYFLREDYSASKKWLEFALKRAQRENNQYRQGIIYYHLYNTEFALGQNQQANQYLQSYASLKEGLDKNQIRSINIIEDELSENRQRIINNDSTHETSAVAVSIIVAFLSCVSIVWIFVKRRKENQVDSHGNHDTLTLMGHDVPQANHDEHFSQVAILKNNDTLRPTKDTKGESYNEAKEVSVEQIKELNHLVKTNDPSFMVKFHEAFPSFAKTISSYAHPSLNNSEIEVCACTKLNFSTKEIALYRNYTLRSVENRKYRIRKKLTLSTEVDFVVWIAAIN